jgi:hypothetical protein
LNYNQLSANIICAGSPHVLPAFRNDFDRISRDHFERISYSPGAENRAADSSAPENLPILLSAEELWRLKWIAQELDHRAAKKLDLSKGERLFSSEELRNATVTWPKKLRD